MTDLVPPAVIRLQSAAEKVWDVITKPNKYPP